MRQPGRALARTTLVAASLAVLAVLLRLPFQVHQLWAWDSVLYARALEQGFHVDYELATQRPHPPGSLFYVVTAAAVRIAAADSNSALVLVSIVASALATAGIFLIARRLASEGAALVAAAAFAVNPLVWTYSEVAYPYTVLGLGSIVVAAACLAARSGRPGGLMLASASLGLAAGFRQDLLLLLGPLWIATLLGHAPRDQIRAVATVAVTSAVWLIPTVVLSDGPGAYLVALAKQTEFVARTYSVPRQGLDALSANLATIAHGVGWGLFLIGAFAPLALAARRGRSFLLLWSAPAIAFFMLVHIGEWGYTLSILPALYVAAAIGLDLASRATAPFGSLRPVLVTAGVVAAAAVFIVSPGPFSASAVETHDRELAARVRYVRATFAAESTAILAREDFLLVRYYLPEYRAWFYDPEPYGKTKARHRKRMTNVTAMVVFTQGLQPRGDQRVDYLECARGVRIAYIPVGPEDILELVGDRYFTSREPE